MVTSQQELSRRQRQVHDMIQSVGGYWHPANGVVRLLEELGELCELIHNRPADGSDDQLAEELADVWIITTCTANQFNVDLRVVPGDGAATRHGASGLLPYAGTIARIINYYDGPKTPRSVSDWPTLGTAIEMFQAELRLLAMRLGVDIDSAIDAKVDRTPARDAGRFAKSYDPSTANVLDRFSELRHMSACTFAERAKLWGGPDWKDDRPVEWNVEVMAPYLTVFAKAAVREGLDGFVVGAGRTVEASGMGALADWFGEFLNSLARNDPRGGAEHAFDGVDRPGWQFSFGGVRMFASVFSSLYPDAHPRHSPSGLYIIFQPEASFDAHHIGSRFPSSERAKEAIRRRFGELGYSYPGELIDQRVEARIYLPPRWEGDSEVSWWSGVAPHASQK